MFNHWSIEQITKCHKRHLVSAVEISIFHISFYSGNKRPWFRKIKKLSTWRGFQTRRTGFFNPRIWSRPSSTYTGYTTGLCSPSRTLSGISGPRCAVSCGTPWFWGRPSIGETWVIAPGVGVSAPVGWASSLELGERATK